MIHTTIKKEKRDFQRDNIKSAAWHPFSDDEKEQQLKAYHFFQRLSGNPLTNDRHHNCIYDGLVIRPAYCDLTIPENSRSHWTHYTQGEYRWPTEYLQHMQQNPEQTQYLQSELKKAGLSDPLTVYRLGGRRFGIANASIDPDMQNKNDYSLWRDRPVYQYKVPHKNVIGIGAHKEHEIFFKFPRGTPSQRIGSIDPQIIYDELQKTPLSYNPGSKDYYGDLQYGRGMYHPESGRVYTWGASDAEHYDMSHLLQIPYSRKTRFTISPSGEVTFKPNYMGFYETKPSEAQDTPDHEIEKQQKYLIDTLNKPHFKPKFQMHRDSIPNYRSSKRIGTDQNFSDVFIDTSPGDRVNLSWGSLKSPTSQNNLHRTPKQGSNTPDFSNAGMISLDIPEDVIKPINNSGAVNQHHITLAFLGDDLEASDDLFQGICRQVKEIAQKTKGPLTGSIEGVGSFPENKESGLTPVYTVPHIEGIEDLHNKLKHLDKSNFPEYKPHVTLAYTDTPTHGVEPVKKTLVSFPEISVHYRGQVAKFPFNNTNKKVNATREQIETKSIIAGREDLGFVFTQKVYSTCNGANQKTSARGDTGYRERDKQALFVALFPIYFRDHYDNLRTEDYNKASANLSNWIIGYPDSAGNTHYQWPHEYLKIAQSDPVYQEGLQNILKKMMTPDPIPVYRAGGRRNGIANGSLLPNWEDKTWEEESSIGSEWRRRKFHKYLIPHKDVVGFGNAPEGEIFFKLQHNNPHSQRIGSPWVNPEWTHMSKPKMTAKEMLDHLADKHNWDGHVFPAYLDRHVDKLNHYHDVPHTGKFAIHPMFEIKTPHNHTPMDPLKDLFHEWEAQQPVESSVKYPESILSSLKNSSVELPQEFKKLAIRYNQLLNKAREYPDSSEIVHEFGDGWSVRKLITNGDYTREGEVMSNCIKDRPKSECEAGCDNGRLETEITCPECDGKGETTENCDYLPDCEDCEGYGISHDENGEYSGSCERCNGSGKDHTHKSCPQCEGIKEITGLCSNCDGDGTILEDQECENCGGCGYQEPEANALFNGNNSMDYGDDGDEAERRERGELFHDYGPIYSLRDPNNVPFVSLEKGGQSEGLLGRQNKIPKNEYLQRLFAWPDMPISAEDTLRNYSRWTIGNVMPELGAPHWARGKYPNTMKHIEEEHPELSGTDWRLNDPDKMHQQYHGLKYLQVHPYPMVEPFQRVNGIDPNQGQLSISKNSAYTPQPPQYWQHFQNRIHSEMGHVNPYEDYGDRVGPLGVDSDYDLGEWTEYGTRWPNVYLAEAEGNPEYQIKLQQSLEGMGFPETVPAYRYGGRRNGIANASILPNWLADSGSEYFTPFRPHYKFAVPRENIIGVGKAKEGEIFFKLQHSQKNPMSEKIGASYLSTDPLYSVHNKLWDPHRWDNSSRIDTLLGYNDGGYNDGEIGSRTLAQDSRRKWITGVVHDGSTTYEWPHEYLDEVKKNPEHYAKLQKILEDHGYSDTVEVHRLGGRINGIANASLMPDWHGMKDTGLKQWKYRKKYTYTIPRASIIGIGMPHEEEVFFKLNAKTPRRVVGIRSKLAASNTYPGINDEDDRSDVIHQFFYPGKGMSIIDNMRSLNWLPNDINESRKEWTDVGHPNNCIWPKEYLDFALNDKGHHEYLQRALKTAGIPDPVEIHRLGGRIHGIANGSLDPDWISSEALGANPWEKPKDNANFWWGRKAYHYLVPHKDIIGIGSPGEKEVFFKLRPNTPTTRETKNQTTRISHIKEEDGFFSVYLEDGTKNLGKGYKTKQEAQKRIGSQDLQRHMIDVHHVDLASLENKNSLQTEQSHSREHKEMENTPSWKKNKSWTVRRITPHTHPEKTSATHDFGLFQDKPTSYGENIEVTDPEDLRMYPGRGAQTSNFGDTEFDERPFGEAPYDEGEIGMHSNFWNHLPYIADEDFQTSDPGLKRNKFEFPDIYSTKETPDWLKMLKIDPTFYYSQPPKNREPYLQGKINKIRDPETLQKISDHPYLSQFTKTASSPDKILQWQNILDTSPEGFSIHPVTGESPNSGYMVGGVAKPDQQIRAEAVTNYIEQHPEHFAGNNPKYVGGWLDSDTGNVVVEPSENIEDLNLAKSLGIQRNQKTIWDVVNKKEIDTGGSGEFLGSKHSCLLCINSKYADMNKGFPRPRAEVSWQTKDEHGNYDPETEKRGILPVPYIAEDGNPARINLYRSDEIHKNNSCQVCGEDLSGQRSMQWVPSKPSRINWDYSGNFGESYWPMHPQCAKMTAKWCPHVKNTPGEWFEGIGGPRDFQKNASLWPKKKNRLDEARKTWDIEDNLGLDHQEEFGEEPYGEVLEDSGEWRGLQKDESPPRGAIYYNHPKTSSRLWEKDFWNRVLSSVEKEAVRYNQLKNEADSYPDSSEIIHTFPDKWSIRKLKTNGDYTREGEVMNNCIKDFDLDDCDDCGGSGKVDEECHQCGGSGKEEDWCPDCDGDASQECPECKGTSIDPDIAKDPEKFGYDKDDSLEDSCDYCEGGEVDCPSCNDDGKISTTCYSCGGSGTTNEDCDTCEGFGKTEINPYADYSGQTTNDVGDVYSLRDPNNVPFVSMAESNGILGRNNQDPKPEYMKRILQGPKLPGDIIDNWIGEHPNIWESMAFPNTIDHLDAQHPDWRDYTAHQVNWHSPDDVHNHMHERDTLNRGLVPETDHEHEPHQVREPGFLEPTNPGQGQMFPTASRLGTSELWNYGLFGIKDDDVDRGDDSETQWSHRFNTPEFDESPFGEGLEKEDADSNFNYRHPTSFDPDAKLNKERFPDLYSSKKVAAPFVKLHEDDPEWAHNFSKLTDKHLGHRSDYGGIGFNDSLSDEDASRYNWIHYNNDWPHKYLASARSNPEYQQKLQNLLKESGVPDPITIHRWGGRRNGIANGSLLPSWTDKDSWDTGKRPLYTFTVPHSSVVGVGDPDEGELFFRLGQNIPRTKDISHLAAVDPNKTWYHVSRRRFDTFRNMPKSKLNFADMGNTAGVNFFNHPAKADKFEELVPSQWHNQGFEELHNPAFIYTATVNSTNPYHCNNNEDFNRKFRAVTDGNSFAPNPGDRERFRKSMLASGYDAIHIDKENGYGMPDLIVLDPKKIQMQGRYLVKRCDTCGSHQFRQPISSVNEGQYCPSCNKFTEASDKYPGLDISASKIESRDYTHIKNNELQECPKCSEFFYEPQTLKYVGYPYEGMECGMCKRVYPLSNYKEHMTRDKDFNFR